MPQPETIRRVCPYLGLTGDPSSHYRQPDIAHYCYSPKEPGAIEEEYQASVCFSSEFRSCARFSQQTQNVPPVPAESQFAPQRRKQWILLGLLALLPIVALVGILVTFRLQPSPVALSSESLATRTRTAIVINTIASTPTPSPSTARRNGFPTVEPLVIPTPPSNGVLFTLSAVPERTGWIASSDQTPRWNERGLLAGSLQTQNYLSIVQFDVSSLAPGSQILFAVMEIAGRDATRLGNEGEWKFDLVDSALAQGWENASFSQINDAPALVQIGSTLTPAQLGPGYSNRFEFNAAQQRLIESQLEYGTLAFRIRGPSRGDNLFTWASGAGTPTLYIVAVPSPFTVVTNTPTPGSVLTAAAVARTATDAATRFGTPTRMGRVATATPDAGVAYVTPIPTPANTATAQFLSNYATAVALTTGTFTPTPLTNRIATPTITPVMILADRLILVPTPSPTLEPIGFLTIQVPDEIKGKIVALSNRYLVPAQMIPTPAAGDSGTARDRYLFNANAPIVIDPADGNVLGILTSEELYQAAVWRETYSPSRQQFAYVSAGAGTISQIWIYDFVYNRHTRITDLQRSIYNAAVILAAYSPAWSPDGRYIAYVSNENGNDDIFVYDFQAQKSTRLTTSSYYWNKHPSWSPDGKKIVFWSNRTGRPQIWVMDADGKNQTNLSNSLYNDINPVWIK